MKTKVLFILLSLTIVISCKKKDGNYVFTTAEELGPFISLRSQDLLYIKALESNLEFGVSYPYSPNIIYISGDTTGNVANYKDVVYNIEFDSSCIQYKQGSMRIIFQPSSEQDARYIITYDSLKTDQFFFLGGMVIYEETYDVYEYLVKGYGIRMWNNKVNLITDVNYRIDYNGINQPLLLRYFEKTGINTSNKEFKYSSSVSLLTNCGEVSSGVIDIKSKKQEWRRLDFGENLTCDGKATVTSGNTSLIFFLP